jgi:unsaturated chondroitin disaccharide hydrolase
MKPVPEKIRDILREAMDLLIVKLAADEISIGLEFPYATDPRGAWKMMPASLSAGYTGDAWSHGNWFCGFWVGLLLAAYLWSEDKRFLIWARERMHLVAPRCEDGNTHDIGFIFYSSALPMLRVTGEKEYARVALRAADRLRARLIPTHAGAYISSWGPLSDERGRRSSAIDTMANLPLLYWAADYAGDGSYRAAAECHARMTRENFIRPDYSTYHAVEYDLPAGTRKRGYTFQGYADESCWSRGQGWAIYGFTASAKATGNCVYLAVAETLAEYYLNRLAEADAMVPLWDFDDPGRPDTLRDSSAAAIVASAMLDMAALQPDPVKGKRWQALGLSMLGELCRDYLARESGHRGLLKHGCYSKPHHESTDSAVLFGDFYFVEALCKVLLPGKFSSEAPRLSPMAAER